MAGDDLVSLMDQRRDFGFIKLQDSGKPTVDEIGGFCQMHIEAGKQCNRGWSIKPIVAHNPLIHCEQAQKAPVRIHANRDEMVNRSGIALRSDEAVEVTVFPAGRFSGMAMIIPLCSGLRIKDVTFRVVRPGFYSLSATQGFVQDAVARLGQNAFAEHGFLCCPVQFRIHGLPFPC